MGPFSKSELASSGPEGCGAQHQLLCYRGLLLLLVTLEPAQNTFKESSEISDHIVSYGWN